MGKNPTLHSFTYPFIQTFIHGERVSVHSFVSDHHMRQWASPQYNRPNQHAKPSVSFLLLFLLFFYQNWLWRLAGCKRYTKPDACILHRRAITIPKLKSSLCMFCVISNQNRLPMWPTSLYFILPSKTHVGLSEKIWIVKQTRETPSTSFWCLLASKLRFTQSETERLTAVKEKNGKKTAIKVKKPNVRNCFFPFWLIR